MIKSKLRKADAEFLDTNGFVKTDDCTFEKRLDTGLYIELECTDYDTFIAKPCKSDYDEYFSQILNQDFFTIEALSAEDAFLDCVELFKKRIENLFSLISNKDE